MKIRHFFQSCDCNIFSFYILRMWWESYNIWITYYRVKLYTKATGTHAIGWVITMDWNSMLLYNPELGELFIWNNFSANFRLSLIYFTFFLSSNKLSFLPFSTLSRTCYSRLFSSILYHRAVLWSRTAYFILLSTRFHSAFSSALL